MSDYDVNLVEDNMQEFNVMFKGPKDTVYEGGIWKIHVELPDQYPYKSPSIGFQNKIFHPNIDESSGSVCLDVINQTWSPMFDVFNVFETFLPQLLSYPNPSDPLNGHASALYLRHSDQYAAKVKSYIERYANPAHFSSLEEEMDEDEDDQDEDLSSVSSIDDRDEIAGEMDL